MPVLLAAAGFLLVGLDGSVNIAFPALSAAFRVAPTTMRWVIICYVGTYALTAFVAYGSLVVTLTWQQSRPTSPLGILPVIEIKMESHQGRLLFF